MRRYQGAPFEQTRSCGCRNELARGPKPGGRTVTHADLAGRCRRRSRPAAASPILRRGRCERVARRLRAGGVLARCHLLGQQHGLCARLGGLRPT